jgi:hypothetical protein
VLEPALLGAAVRLVAVRTARGVVMQASNRLGRYEGRQWREQ